MKRIFIFVFMSIATVIFWNQNNVAGQSKQSNGGAEDSVVKIGNTSTTFSTDVEQLGKMLDFSKYKPYKVKFKFIFIDNSGQGTTPGPSHFDIEALMYFDSVTFNKMSVLDLYADYPSPDLNKDSFKYDWLDGEIVTELKNSNKSYHGHPDFFFSRSKGKSWYLNRKILFRKSN